jgi:GAF domain-containing protein
MSLWTPDGERPIPPKPSEPELTPEEEEQAKEMARELAEARARLLETEVSTVLANHALGIYELAAIHLTADAPQFAEAQLAIDGLAALVDGLAGRLGDSEATLKDALHQVRLAFVQRSKETSSATSS